MLGMPWQIKQSPCFVPVEESSKSPTGYVQSGSEQFHPTRVGHSNLSSETSAWPHPPFSFLPHAVTSNNMHLCALVSCSPILAE